MTLAEILAAIQLINSTLPVWAGLILSMKNQDGTVSTITLLDAADKQNEINILEAQKFIDENSGQ